MPNRVENAGGAERAATAEKRRIEGAYLGGDDTVEAADARDRDRMT